MRGTCAGRRAEHSNFSAEKYACASKDTYGVLRIYTATSASYWHLFSLVYTSHYLYKKRVYFEICSYSWEIADGFKTARLHATRTCALYVAPFFKVRGDSPSLNYILWEKSWLIHQESGKWFPDLLSKSNRKEIRAKSNSKLNKAKKVLRKFSRYCFLFCSVRFHRCADFGHAHQRIETLY